MKSPENSNGQGRRWSLNDFISLPQFENFIDFSSRECKRNWIINTPRGTDFYSFFILLIKTIITWFLLSDHTDGRCRNLLIQIRMRRTATFIAETGVSIWRTKRRRRRYECINQQLGEFKLEWYIARPFLSVCEYVLLRCIKCYSSLSGNMYQCSNSNSNNFIIPQEIHCGVNQIFLEYVRQDSQVI